MKESPQETMPTAIQLRIISNTPGRLRLRVPQQHRQPHTIAQISSVLKTVFHEVREIKTSVRTGSITVYYTPYSDSFNDIVTALREFGIAIGDVLPGKSEAAANITSAMTSLNQRVNQATKGSVDLRFLVPLALAAFALQQLHSKGSHSKRVPWYTLAWYAFDSFVKLHYTSETSEPPSSRDR